MTQTEYYSLLGQVVYKYLGLQYGVTLLGNKLAPSLVSFGDIKVLGSIAHDFQVLSFTASGSKCLEVAKSFADVTQTFQQFLQTTPYGDNDGLNQLGSSELTMYWSPDECNEFISKLDQVQNQIDTLSESFV